MRRQGSLALVLVVATLVAVRVLPAAAQGCAMCGSALADDPLGRAFNWSILFLMAVPYAVVGTAGAWLYFMHRRAPGRRRGSVIDLAEAGRGRLPTKA